MGSRSLLRLACCIGIFSGCMAVTGTTRAADPPASTETAQFDIKPQPLASALDALALQSHQQILFTPEIAKGKTTQGVRGTLTADAALTQVLAGTGLSSSRTADGMILVSRADAKGASAPPDPQGAPTGAANDQNQSHQTRGAQEATSLEEVVVTGHYEFLSVDTSGTTNLPLPIEKVPQSISLVSNDFIEAADLKTLGEIAEYTPGAVNAGSSENYNASIFIRGFSPGRALDGLPSGVPSGYPLYEPDYAIFDRLEVVKGPSSVVYGISGPGGLVNFVTKSATAETQDYLLAQYGSWNSFRIEGQAAGALDSEGRVRVIGVVVQDQGDSFFNQLYHKKTSVYGGLNVRFSDSVTGYLHAGYERFERPSFDGNPTLPDGSLPPVFRSFCLCSEGVVMTSSVYHAEGDLTWHANDMWDVSLKGNYERTKTDGTTIFGDGLESTGDITLFGGTLDALDENYAFGLSSVYHLDSLGLKNSFISFEALNQSSTIDTSGLSAEGATNIFDGQAAVMEDINSAVSGAEASPASFVATTQRITNTTLSLQGVFQLLSPLSLLAGASYAKPEINENIYGTVGDFKPSGQMSYRAGLTYEVAPRTNLYFSYSQSFAPQGGFQINGSNLPNLTGDQYEAGVKYRTESGRLLLTGALFQIKEKNVSEYFEQVGPITYYAPIGEVRHRGFELQALGQLTPQWQINAGYAYLDPVITGALPSVSATVGQQQLFLPKQTFSLYTTYTLGDGILRGLSFGGGVRYVSNQPTSYASALANEQSYLTPSNDLPGYILVDLLSSYSWGKWLFQLNVRNVLNKNYFLNNYQTLTFGNLPGDPTNVVLSVRRSF
jgi:TonB-dependent siderophore receptor